MIKKHYILCVLLKNTLHAQSLLLHMMDGITLDAPLDELIELYAGMRASANEFQFNLFSEYAHVEPSKSELVSFMDKNTTMEMIQLDKPIEEVLVELYAINERLGKEIEKWGRRFG